MLGCFSLVFASAVSVSICLPVIFRVIMAIVVAVVFGAVAWFSLSLRHSREVADKPLGRGTVGRHPLESVVAFQMHAGFFEDGDVARVGVLVGPVVVAVVVEACGASIQGHPVPPVSRSFCVEETIRAHEGRTGYVRLCVDEPCIHLRFVYAGMTKLCGQEGFDVLLNSLGVDSDQLAGHAAAVA